MQINPFFNCLHLKDILLFNALFYVHPAMLQQIWFTNAFYGALFYWIVFTKWTKKWFINVSTYVKLSFGYHELPIIFFFSFSFLSLKDDSVSWFTIWLWRRMWTWSSTSLDCYCYCWLYLVSLILGDVQKRQCVSHICFSQSSS